MFSMTLYYSLDVYVFKAAALEKVPVFIGQVECQGSEEQLSQCDSGPPNRECSYAHVGCTGIESVLAIISHVQPLS